MAKGCILGCITVSSSNYSVDFKEGVTEYNTTIATGDYFPDSATGAEDLAAVVAAAMTAAGGTYTISVNSATGLFRIESPAAFELLIASNSDSIFRPMGFGTADLSCSYDGANYYIDALTPPEGTWYPRTVDDGEELAADTLWEGHSMGASQITTAGQRHKRTWGSFETRQLTYDNLAGPEDFSYPHGDIERAYTCWKDHWKYGKRVRVYPASRTITTAVPTDGYAAFEAAITNDDFKPSRVSSEIDWWTWTVDFHRWVT